MNKVFERIKKRIVLTATEACAYRENIRVISEAELKTILEEEFVTDINVGNNGWIPVTERLPKNNDNVRVTIERNGRLEVGVGWYNHDKEKWKMCPSDDEEFFYYYGFVVAWKEIKDEPYNPVNSKKTNADRIRSMTDEELANGIFKNTARSIDETIPFCKNKEKCLQMMDSLEGIPEHMCRQCVLEWLQQEGGVSG